MAWLESAAVSRVTNVLQEPVVPPSLTHAAVDGVSSTKSRETAMLKRLRHLSFETSPDVVVKRVGRPTMRFVDIGVKFVDVKDRLKRIQAAKRRTSLKLKRQRYNLDDASFSSQPEVSATAYYTFTLMYYITMNLIRIATGNSR